MTDCYFCGSDIEAMKAKQPKGIKSKMDRYFIDKQDKKNMCKLCGQHYIKRQFLESLPTLCTEGDTDEYWEFIQKRFEMVKL